MKVNTAELIGDPLDWAVAQCEMMRADYRDRGVARASHRLRATNTSVTHKLQTMVVEAGWIYNVHPSTTYFEVIEGRLYAKYQQVIGSRYICDIIDYKEQQS